MLPVESDANDLRCEERRKTQIYYYYFLYRVDLTSDVISPLFGWLVKASGGLTWL